MCTPSTHTPGLQVANVTLDGRRICYSRCIICRKSVTLRELMMDEATISHPAETPEMGYFVAHVSCLHAS